MSAKAWLSERDICAQGRCGATDRAERMSYIASAKLKHEYERRIDAHMLIVGG